MKLIIEKALNEQINREFYSAYLYLSMSFYLETLNLPGAAMWMKNQWKEENMHAEKFCDFINDRGGKVKLGKLEQPPAEFESLEKIFELSLDHEKYITQSINNLYELAQKEKDYSLVSMLHWYIDEQVEEEKSVEDILEKIKLIGESKQAIFMLDKELSERNFEANA